MAVVLTPENLQLRKLDEPKLGEFLLISSLGRYHRRKFGGGRGEAKAVGIKKIFPISLMPLLA